MSFLDTIKAAVGGLGNEVAKFQNTSFLDAAIGASIAVSAADGTIDSAEKAKLAKFISMHDALKLFKSSDVMAYITKYTDLFEFDNAMGMQEVLKAVQKLQDKPDQAKTMVLLACAIGSSDGDFDETEKSVVRTIVKTVGLSPSTFSL